jgi:hypothetical protein
MTSNRHSEQTHLNLNQHVIPAKAGIQSKKGLFFPWIARSTDCVKTLQNNKNGGGLFVIPREGGESMRKKGFIRRGLPAFAGNDNLGLRPVAALGTFIHPKRLFTQSASRAMTLISLDFF